MNTPHAPLIFTFLVASLLFREPKRLRNEFTLPV